MANTLRSASVNDLIQSMIYLKNENTAFLQNEAVGVIGNLIQTGIGKNTVSVYMPYCYIKDNQETGLWPFKSGDAQVYVVSLALDLSGSPSNINGIDQSKKSPIGDIITRTTNMNFNISVTPLFNNVLDNEKLPLSGNGIMLYGPKDPIGLLELHVAIVEDDEGFRKLGNILEQEINKSQVIELIKNVTSLGTLANPQVIVLRNAFQLLFSSIVLSLQNNQDDIIQELHFSSLYHQEYLSGIHTLDGQGAKIEFVVDVQKP